MKKEEILSLVKLLLAPVLVILLGLILILNPDSAAVLISKLLGSILIVIGVGFGISGILEEKGRIPKAVTAVLLAVAGGWLVNNPLALAAWIGRFVGALLVINGLQDIRELRRCGKTFLLPLTVAAVGAVLILLPMTTSRLVFTLCGAVVLAVGGTMLLDRLRTRPRLKSAGDIVDAE